MRVAFVALAILALSCGSRSEPTAPSGEITEVVYERMPDGSVRKTTITRRSVPAPPPPARPADAYPGDPLVRYNVERVNAYRARGGLPPLLYDARISAFAVQGSQRLARDHVPHAHFAENAQAQRFGSRSAENQGDPRGVPSLHPDPATNARRQIDTMLEMMFAEGPGGGHYDNMMNPKFRRIGIGNVYVGGRLYMTNDFSD
ncbi:MAG: CAP domain-containing protein [Labilithrix sp.]|nr:CAP domain-containing protein [Labilithrix sp.]